MTDVSFDVLNEELHYRQAKRTLRDMVEKLDLTPRERSGLEPDLEELQDMLHRLENQVVQIAVFGMVGRGKSSLLNALLGKSLFETGPTHGITQQAQSAQWEVTQENSVKRVALRSFGHARLELVDTPGIDEIAGEKQTSLAQRIAQQSDLILFIVAGDMTRVEFEALAQLREASKPILLVFNKIDQYAPPDREAIYRKIRDDRVRQLLSPEEIVLAAAAPLVAKAVPQVDGSLEIEMVPGSPKIEDLKLKILDVLDREGKSLVALNSLLFADEIHDRVIQRKMFIRDHRANRLIWNAVMTQAVVIAVSPITVIDVISAGVINTSMILSLSKLYGITMTHRGALELLKKIALCMGGISAGDLFTHLGLGALKGLMGATTPGAYVPVALTQATIGGVSSYGMGLITKEYLANGASWGPEGPKTVISRILDSLDQASIMGRIKTDLKAKLGATL